MRIPVKHVAGAIVPAFVTGSPAVRPLSLLILSPVVLAPHGASAAQDLVVADTEECQACFDIERVAVLGTDEGPGALTGQPRSVVQDRQGRFYVVEYVDPTAIKVFATDGDYLFDIGSEGRGPEEFVALAALWISEADSVFAFDAGQARTTVYGPDLEMARTFRTEWRPSDIVMLSSGDLAVAADVRTPAKIGLPLHVIDLRGKILRSFGGDGTFRPDIPEGGMDRQLSAGSDGGFWVAHSNQYVIERWSPAGELQARIIRDARWFRPYLRRAIGRDHVDPLVMAISERDGGVLRTLVSVAGKDWQEVLPEPIRRGNQVLYPVETGSGAYERLVEDIDPSGGRILRAQRFEQEFLGFMGKDLVYAYRLEGPGFPRIEIWRFVD